MQNSPPGGDMPEACEQVGLAGEVTYAPPSDIALANPKHVSLAWLCWKDSKKPSFSANHTKLARGW